MKNFFADVWQLSLLLERTRAAISQRLHVWTTAKNSGAVVIKLKLECILIDPKIIMLSARWPAKPC